MTEDNAPYYHGGAAEYYSVYRQSAADKDATYPHGSEAKDNATYCLGNAAKDNTAYRHGSVADKDAG